ncbi:MAG: UDP-N-acetylmuramoyl-L-alanine--D-glutamate ligase [Polyangiaceae bacterium]
MTTEADFWADLRRERFLVVGFSERTGMHAGRLFARMGVPFAVSDSASMEVLAPRVEALRIERRSEDGNGPPPFANEVERRERFGRGGLREAKAGGGHRAAISKRSLGVPDVFAGPQTSAQLDGITAVLLSPGVPRSIPLLVEARARGIPIWSDYDLLHPIYAHKRVAAITGTDGKTTTTMLVAHMLREDARVVVAGNMGTPITALYDEIRACDALVLELSSFMLEEVRRFHAGVSTVLNVAEDHVDRYASLDEYEATKRAILKHARRPDVFVQNLDDPKIAGWPVDHVDVRAVSSRGAAPRDAAGRGCDAWFEDGRLHVGGASIDADRLRIRGIHHRSNALVAASMAVALGVDPEAALERATTFPGVPHRFEHVGRAGGVDLVDDSKATSVHAVQRALESLADRRVVLILGGRDKMLDPTPLGRVTGPLRAVVGYGEAGPRLLKAFPEGGPALAYVERFADAVERACRLTEPGDVLLLSPACTSFDQHTDYAERGAEFREVARRTLG